MSLLVDEETQRATHQKRKECACNVHHCYHATTLRDIIPPPSLASWLTDLRMGNEQEQAFSGGRTILRWRTQWRALFWMSIVKSFPTSHIILQRFRGIIDNTIPNYFCTGFFQHDGRDGLNQAGKGQWQGLRYGRTATADRCLEATGRILVAATFVPTPPRR